MEDCLKSLISFWLRVWSEKMFAEEFWGSSCCSRWFATEMAFLELARRTGGVSWRSWRVFAPFFEVGLRASIKGTVEWLTFLKLISCGPVFLSEPFEGEAENYASH